MSRWMLELSEKETERRAKVAAFMKAAPSFLDALEKELKSSADAYTKQFPNEGVDVGLERSDSRIHIINARRGTGAIVGLNAVTQRVACFFQNVNQAKNW